MRILMINKFLHPNGGAETYIFQLGEQLEALGHEVQYFGMEHPQRRVGNRVQAYTANMDFHGGSKLSKLLYPVKTVYSSEARRKLRAVLEDFKPQVCHLNNFNYQLTPSILLEIAAWKKQGNPCRVVYTAHDYQLVCPNHMCNRPATGENCEKCLGGHFVNCLKGRCIHGSAARSAVGFAEATIWNKSKVYRHLDTVICCSAFLKTKLDTDPLLRKKTVVLHNFIPHIPQRDTEKQDYVLYFGRFSPEKGIGTLLEACSRLPRIPFVFAGAGPMEQAIEQLPNTKNVGFQTGAALERLIREARFTVYPSAWYENCPFSVMESQAHGTPVLGAAIGGIPELIVPGVTGELFASGDADALTSKIQELWEAPARTAAYSANCGKLSFDTVDAYCEKLLKYYSPNEGGAVHG